MLSNCATTRERRSVMGLRVRDIVDALSLSIGKTAFNK
jgi:hypothetical protein